jgi:hypothetical protein
MADFTVGNFSSDSSGPGRGQSFTPNVAGDGTGSPGGATTVYVEQVDIEYVGSNITHRANTAYIYDHVPTSSQLSSGTGALDTSTGYSDGSAFGTGSYSRSYAFNRTALTPSTKYYVFFPAAVTIAYTDSDVYSGGDMYSATLSVDTYDVQFRVTMANS